MALSSLPGFTPPIMATDALVQVPPGLGHQTDEAAVLAATVQQEQI